MSAIDIKGNKDTPSVFVDDVIGLLRVIGASFSENPYAVYGPVLDWLEHFGSNHALNSLQCEFYYTYLNSASKKLVYEIMVMLEDFHAQGKDIHVEWSYDEFDDDMLELGHEFAELIDLPFEYKPQ